MWSTELIEMDSLSADAQKMVREIACCAWQAEQLRTRYSEKKDAAQVEREFDEQDAARCVSDAALLSSWSEAFAKLRQDKMVEAELQNRVGVLRSRVTATSEQRLLLEQELNDALEEIRVRAGEQLDLSKQQGDHGQRLETHQQVKEQDVHENRNHRSNFNLSRGEYRENALHIASKCQDYKIRAVAAEELLAGFDIDTYGHAALAAKRGVLDALTQEAASLEKLEIFFYGLNPDPVLAKRQVQEARLKLASLEDEFKKLVSELNV